MKYNLVFLYKFNNYFNRKIIFFSTLTDYTSDYEYLLIPDSNFNPNDGVNTLHILNANKLEENDEAVPEFDNLPDYLLLLDAESNDILSRWFVTNAVRTTGNQYNLTLKRDVISDHFETLKNCPVYVLKGNLKDSDPMILNDEGLLFNQIKKEEILLKDESHSAWIVGYMENSASTSGTTPSGATPGTSYTLSQIATAIGGNMTEADLIAAINGQIEFNNSNDFNLIYAGNTNAGFILPTILKADDSLNFIDYELPSSLVISWIGLVGKSNITFSVIADNNMTWLNANKATLLNAIATYRQKYFSNFQYQSLMNYNGKTISYGGKYYKISIMPKYTQDVKFDFVSKTGLLSAMTASAGWSETYNDGLYYIEYKAIAINILLEEDLTASYSFKIDASHNTLQDAPYSMFALPYSNIEFITPSDPLQPAIGAIGGEAALAIAASIAEKLGTKLYDIQLVPFCPFDYNDVYNLDNLVEGTDFDFITLSGNNAGAILYPKKSNFNKFINLSLNIKTSLKVDSQCRFYRLCSPNYNGVFEFNLAKDGGSVSGFYVDCTYKPFTPYIRIAPEFKLLYGANYHDGRGLICAGDFSLPIISDAWTQYQIQNKNYANIFNREIKNLDVSQKQEAFLQALQAGAGTITGGAAGALAGAKVGGLYGAFVGAAVGTIGGAIGGVIDINMGAERRKEARDYAIDRFNLSLMNIKAQPDSLVKNSAFTINNKVFPFLEFYEPTEEEIEALINKIEYDGMTVNRIDKIVNFYEESTPHYFKGQLIRWLNDLESSRRVDSSQINAISEELLKGVYI